MSETMQTPVTRREKFLYKIAGGDIDLPTPITRVELYLFVIAGGTIDLPTPEIRCEYFLAKAAGMDVAVPTPITRWEKYLYKLCGYEIELPTPVTREEMYLYLAGSAEERTVTGIPPLTIVSDGTDATVTIYGNMSQTSTPSPTTPIQPQECGDRTGNLFDKDSTTIYNAYIGTDGTWRLSDDSRSIKIPVLGNTQYTLSINSDNNAVFRIYESNNSSAVPVSGSSVVLSLIVRDTTIKEYTFTTSADTQMIVFQGSSSVVTEWFSSLMLNTGTTALPYEPYGYKIPILSANTTTPVYLGEVQSTRQIKKLVLTGEEQFLPHQTIASWFQLFLSDIVIDNLELCTHYKPSPYNPADIQNGEILVRKQTSADNGRIIIKDTAYTTTADFKTYLAQQYAAGTPVTVWYVLATPQTAIVNEPIRKIGEYADSVSGISIPTAVGSNTIDVDTTLKPSEMTITYRG